MVCEENDKILGFVIGRIMKASEVYDPGGLTLMSHDFCIAKELSWGLVGKKLIDEIKILAVKRGVIQLVIVSGTRDEEKNKFLSKIDLSIVSHWYVGNIF